MRRVVLVVLLALLTFDVSGLSGLCDEADCDEPCPTDLEGGQCPPNCHFCSCCSLPKVAGATTIALEVPTARATVAPRASDRLPCPEPADILHVPKLSFA